MSNKSITICVSHITCYTSWNSG